MGVVFVSHTCMHLPPTQTHMCTKKWVSSVCPFWYALTPSQTHIYMHRWILKDKARFLRLLDHVPSLLKVSQSLPPPPALCGCVQGTHSCLCINNVLFYGREYEGPPPAIQGALCPSISSNCVYTFSLLQQQQGSAGQQEGMAAVREEAASVVCCVLPSRVHVYV